MSLFEIFDFKNDALLRKDGRLFWKCWRSKFEQESKTIDVDGCIDANIIADKFAEYFSNCYSCNSTIQKEYLEVEYAKLRENYRGFPVPTFHLIVN